jgi:hypothetical protein
MLCSILIGCANQATLNSLAAAQQACVYGNVEACADVPAIQSEINMEKQESAMVALDLALLIPLVAIAVTGGGGGWHSGHAHSPNGGHGWSGHSWHH